MSKKRTISEERRKGFILWIKLNKMIAQLLMRFGKVHRLTLAEQKEAVELVKDVLFQTDSASVLLEWKRAAELGQTMIEAEMREIGADDLIRLKYRGPTQ